VSVHTYAVRAVTALHGVEDKPTVALVNALLDMSVHQEKSNHLLLSVAHNLNRIATALERVADVVAPGSVDGEEDDEVEL
jgi:hypothetical protein